MSEDRRESDLQRAWREKQEGFAAAADMIGDLLAAWREAVHERDVLAAEVRACREAWPNPFAMAVDESRRAVERARAATDAAGALGEGA